jgi:hypothetical protein
MATGQDIHTKGDVAFINFVLRCHVSAASAQSRQRIEQPKASDDVFGAALADRPSADHHAVKSSIFDNHMGSEPTTPTFWRISGK